MTPLKAHSAHQIPLGPLVDTIALFAPIASAESETAVFGYFDPDWQLLGMRHVPSLLAGEVTIPLREILADALAFNCIKVVMAHNHPSGDVTPSRADYALTRRLARALETIEVQLVDHVILARGEHESFRQRGLL